jgi:alanyl-tRNA synthetase
MGHVFPELKDNQKKIKDIIKDEEKSFEKTLVKVILVAKNICINVDISLHKCLVLRQHII